MNVEQPGIMNRPKRVNAQATGFLPRRSKDIEQRLFNRPLIARSRMKPGKEEHLHVVCFFVMQLLNPGMQRLCP
jgi:hypothetical protein